MDLVQLPSKPRGAGEIGSLIGLGSSTKRTKYSSTVVVLALNFPSHHKPSSPLYQEWAPFGSTVAL